MPYTQQQVADMMEKAVIDIGTLDKNMMNSPDMGYGIMFRVIKNTKAVVEIRSDENTASAALVLNMNETREIGTSVGKSQRYTQNFYGGRFSYGQDVDTFDGGEKIIAKGIKALGVIIPDVFETLTVAMVENGTGAVAVPVINGVPLYNNRAVSGSYAFSTTHGFFSSPRTNSNYLAGSSLDETGLNAAANLPMNWVNERGRKMRYRAKGLVIPVGQRQNAIIMLKSEFVPDTADNRVNTVREDLGPNDFKVWAELTSQTAYYVQTNVPKDKMPAIRVAKEAVPRKFRMEGIDADVVEMKAALGPEMAFWPAHIRVG